MHYVNEDRAAVLQLERSSLMSVKPSTEEFLQLFLLKMYVIL